MATVRWKTIANLIKLAVGRAAGRRAMENKCKSNQTCSWGEQVAAVRWKVIVNLIKRAVGESSRPAVRWKTIIYLIKRAVGEGSWPPYDGKQL